MRRLAEVIAANHRESWFKDFISAPPSERGNQLLLEAIRLNHSGDADHAWKAAARAETVFLRKGNQAGALRSSFEQIYALRRGSKGQECLRKGHSMQLILHNFNYPWISAQTAMELSSCAVMVNHTDQSRRFSQQALNTATRAHYGNLYLRALALQGNLDMLDGLSEATWRTDETGLKQFWMGAYPDERAFQFYHDLQFDAETKGLSNLALLLQRETLAMIAGHGRYDFEALAHFRMAEAEGALGSWKQAQAELDEYQSLISRLPISSTARTLYQAYCDIGLATLAIRSGSQSDAADHLHKALPIASTTDNAFLKLEYLQALSEYDRISLDTSKEEQVLRDILALAHQQFEHTSSPSDRWHMRQTLDGAQRRLLEIMLHKPHDPLQTFAEWHWWREIESTSSITSISPLPEAWTRTQLARMGPGTLLSFVVLPHSVVAWIVSNRGVQEQVLPVIPEALQSEVRLAYVLCSDPDSNLQKVNAAGSRLYEMLVAPLHLSVEPGQEIRIVTDSFLSYVPWTALRTPENQYWGFVQNLTVHTGFGFMHLSKPNSRLNRLVIALPRAVTVNGEKFLPLPHAQEEANYVSKLYPEARILGTGDVTTSRLRSELASADALHFAGHALSWDGGGELITDEEQGSSFLTASALRHTAMPHVQLVVLSACTTAAPGLDADQSPDGLVNAFVQAGIPVVIASRWDVDSASTAQLMRSFYTLLKSGNRPDQALKGAQQHLAENSMYQHPYYWSGFQKFD